MGKETCEKGACRMNIMQVKEQPCKGEGNRLGWE